MGDDGEAVWAAAVVGRLVGRRQKKEQTFAIRVDEERERENHPITHHHKDS